MEKDWVVLKIDPHRMWVSLAIKEPEGEEEPIFSPEFIEEYLKENGIRAGIIKEALVALSETTPYGEDVIVAKGKEAVKGKDGFYQYMVPLEDAKSKPVINDDGSVDYFNSLKLAMVKADEVFAIYIPPTPGEYGYTVFAEMIPPVKGRDLRRLKGKGFAVSDDGKEYKALIDGRIYKQGERIVIEKVYFVKGDLDIEQGNIRFNGDVEIRGDVRSGLMIETDGDIFIHGHVGSSHLVAGGNITIRKGVQGRNKCVISAGKDVALSFAERCIVNAGGEIYAESALDSELNARGKIHLNSKKGLVLGGVATAMQGIEVKEAGNETGVPTLLQTGAMPEHISRLAELKETIEKVSEEIDVLEKNLKLCDMVDGKKRNKETENLRMNIVRAKVIKTTDLKRYQDEADTLNSDIDEAKKNAVVRVTGIAHTGITVCIGRNQYVMKDSCKDVIFKNTSANEIVLVPGDED